ncbi:hypothetical protein V1264_009218 [Littorina saxatilis]|uniref:Uncharacterized protein n=1 Tax=Littorina saxatilis TaxID=31220 RepID=A0AAN9AQY9_9CAEN
MPGRQGKYCGAVLGQPSECLPGQQGKDCNATVENQAATPKLRIAGIASGAGLGFICLTAIIVYICKARAGRGEGPGNCGKRKEPTSALENSQQASPPQVTIIAPEQDPNVALPLDAHKSGGSQESSEVDTDVSSVATSEPSEVDTDVSSVATSLTSDSSAYQTDRIIWAGM